MSLCTFPYWELCELWVPRIGGLRQEVVPINPHRSCHGEDPLVMLVPHLDDDVTEVALHQPARSDLSRRVRGHLHGSVHTVQLGALSIAHEFHPRIKVEIV